MREPFTRCERVLVIAMVCVAAALMPAGVSIVSAVTGTLVNVIDPVNAGRQARVSAAGAMYVETRAGVPVNAFNAQNGASAPGVAWALSTTYPMRTAITEITITAYGFGTAPQAVMIGAWFTSADGACFVGSATGFASIRRVRVANNSTLQLTFPGSPLLVPNPASGQKVCVGFQTDASAGNSITVGVSGYRYTP